MIPTRAMAWLAAIPLVLSGVVVVLPEAAWPLLALDLVLLGLVTVDALTATGGVAVEREVHEVQAVGRPFDVALVVRNEGSRGAALRLMDSALQEASPVLEVRLGPRMRDTLSYTTRVDQRGKHAFGPVSVRWPSRLGLWERQIRMDVPGLVRVYPDFGAQRRAGIEARLREEKVPARARRRPGGESEFERLRPYVPGDAYRHIDWKATARRRHFVTRQFRQEQNQNVIFLLDTGRMMGAHCGELVAFDHALSAAVVMGQQALKAGDRVGLLAFDSDLRAWLPPKGGARSGNRLIHATYDLFPTVHEPDYALALRHLGQRVRRRSLVVLLTSVADEASADLVQSVSSALGKRHLVVQVWLRDPNLDALVVEKAASVEDQYARAAAAHLVAWRERSLAKLRQSGALVVDVPPEQLTASLLSRYLEVKARRLL